MAIRVREFKGPVVDMNEGVKEYRIYEWELDNGTFEYGLACPLHNPSLGSTLPEPSPQRQDEVICQGCKHKYLNGVYS